MNPMQAMPQQAPMGGRPPMGGQPPMGPMGGPPMGPMGGPQGGPPMQSPMGGVPFGKANVNIPKVKEFLETAGYDQLEAYANGSNEKEVPAVMALMELMRRKKAKQAYEALQTPTQTVKDSLTQEAKIEQAAGLASLAGQKQQQAQQQQMAQSLQAPGPVPGGIPPPEDQAEPPMMARGGLAALPVSNRMVSYREGGIVGYAEGKVVERPYIGYKSPRRQEMVIENPDVDENGNPRGRDEREAILAKNAMIARQSAQEDKIQAAKQAERMRPNDLGLESLKQFYKPRPTQGPVAATVPSQEPTGSFIPTATLDASIEDIKDPIERARARRARDNQIKAGKLTLPPQMPLPGQGAPSAMPAAMPGAAPAGLAALAGAMPQGGDRLQVQTDRAEELIKRMNTPQVISPEQQALINMPVEQDYMKRLRELDAKRGEADIRSRADIAARRDMDLSRALIAAGEASRGQSGLGALAAGFGKSSLASREARMNEEAALRASGLSRAELLEKAQFEMNGLQRARAIGDRDREQKHMMELQKIEAELRKQMVSSAGSVTGAEIGADTRAEVGEARIGQREAELELKKTQLVAQTRLKAQAEIDERAKDYLGPYYKLYKDPAVRAKAVEDRVKQLLAAEGVKMAESTTASPIDLSKWGKPTKQ